LRRRRLAWLVLPGVLCALLSALPAAADGPTVAVLPFRVHSAKPIEYLGESVANLLQEQLQEKPGLQVVARSAVREALADEAAPTLDAELRRMATSLGAGHIVTGSLTELAGRYSLDVRVIPVDVGARPLTQVVTASDDEELLAAVGQLADGIAKHVLGAAPSRVAAIEVLAPSELRSTLQSLITIRKGDPYDPAQVNDDVARMLENPDIADVEVETDAVDGGVVVRFRVLRASPFLAEPRAPTAGRTVSEVRVRGNRRIEAAALLARLGTAPGEPISRAQIARDVRALYAMSFFRDVRAFVEPDEGGVAVIFEVEENPVIRQISISGNESIDADKIRDVLTITTGTTLDQPLLFENRARVNALYRAQGYYLADVSYEVEALSESSVAVHFLVDENEKLKLRKIEFVGNEHFSDRELRADFRTRTWKLWSYATSWFDKSGTYSEALFLQDLQNVRRMYGDAGYLQMEMGEPEVSASESGIEVRVEIVEGPRFRVGRITISGDPSADQEALYDEVELEEGEYFNRSQLTEDVKRIQDNYTNRGFFYANVEPRNNLAAGSLVVDVDYFIRRGPLYFIRQIDISGNTTTVDPVIRREIPIVEGELYSQRKIDIGRQRVRRLNFFEEVDILVEPTPEPEQLDLEVSVVEKPTGSFSFGAGFSSQDSFLLNGSLSQANLFGRGWAVALNADIGRQTQRFFFSIRDPSFLGSEWSLGATAFQTRLRFESFDQDSLGFEITGGHALSEDNRSAGFARYNFSSRQIDQSTNVAAASLILREIFQEKLQTSLAGLTLTTDHRNDTLSPTDGYLASASLEAAGLGFFSRFLRFEARGARYFPMPEWFPLPNSTFVLTSRVGWAIPFNSIGDFDLPEVTALDQGIITNTCVGDQCAGLGQIDRDLKLPLSERYFLGGIGQFQLRGFKARSVGPRRPLLVATGPDGTVFVPRGREGEFQGDGSVVTAPGVCLRGSEDLCNDLTDKDLDDFEVPQETDVIGGNKFVSSSVEFRFPISESFGLEGIGFFDTGNAFAEGDHLFDVRDWRYGTGAGVRWFSPFGPILVVLGFPIDRVAELEDSPVFEFSVGGG
jgi:outer membrane protein insertion porin family